MSKRMEQNSTIMKDFVCGSCFYSMEDCNCVKHGTRHKLPDVMVHIDSEIQKQIRILNEKGYVTTECCAGHNNNALYRRIYITFNKAYPFESIPEGFQYNIQKQLIECNLDRERFDEEKAIALSNLLFWVNALDYYSKYEELHTRIQVSTRQYNASHIKGKMAEYLVMFQLMTYRGWDVEYVDYVGADLIAIDTTTNKRYAIQVKMRHYITDGETNHDFTFDSEIKLRNFAKKMSDNSQKMIPIVAYVVINKDQSVNTFLINLDQYAKMRKEGQISTTTEGGMETGYIFNSASKLNDMLIHENVQYIRMIPEMKFWGSLDQPVEYIQDQNYLVKYETIKAEKQKRKREKAESHASMQIGDFGEAYFMMKAVAGGMQPFLIKSVGADFILLDPEDDYQAYAVSVKTFSKKEFDSYDFEETNVNKLREFAEKWSTNSRKMIPQVALQFMIYRDTFPAEKRVKEYYKMYNFIIDLETIIHSQKDYLKEVFHLNGTSRGYQLDWSRGITDEMKRLLKFDEVIFNEPYFETE